jgi:hypothetical protein
MAERIDPAKLTVHKGGAPRKYPWDEWMDGSCWKLKAGVDYQVSTESFRATAYKQATRSGYTVQILRISNGLTVQFTKKSAETGEKKEEGAE